MIVPVAFGGGANCQQTDVATALHAHPGGSQLDFQTETFIAHSLRGEGFDASEDGTGRGTPLVPIYMPEVAATMVARSSRGGGHTNSPGHQADGEVIAYRTAGDGAVYQEGDVIAPLTTGTDSSANILTHAPAIAFDSRMRGAEPAVGREERPPQTMVERTGAIDATKPWNVATAMQVRRLTPMECERLQGFPDGYTDVPHRNKPAADGPRYKALGNSWAVPNVRWIGERIDAVANMTNQPLAPVNIEQHATPFVAELEQS